MLEDASIAPYLLVRMCPRVGNEFFPDRHKFSAWGGQEIRNLISLIAFFPKRSWSLARISLFQFLSSS
jgi:hypothetical protein